jgi:lipoprotein-releasing system permease protein
VAVTGERSRTAEGRSGYERFIALRFLRARRQGFLSLIGLLSALGFAVGVASLTVALALMTGFQEDMIDKILGANAHLLVFPTGGTPILEKPGTVIDRLEAVEGVEAAAPVVNGKGVLLSEVGVTQWATINGVEPALTRRVTDIDEGMVAGSLDDLTRATPSGKPPIVLGERLAARLGVGLGDRVQMLVPRPKVAPWGVSIRRPVFEVVGLFATEYESYDAEWSFLSIDQARDLLNVGEGAHWVAGRVADIDELKPIKERAQQALAGAPVVVEDIMRHNRALFSALELEKLLMFCAVGLIVLVAALGVVSTLVLTVTQKVRVVGVLVAMGATPGGILRIFVLQGAAMGILGTVVGAVTGVALCWVLDTYRLISLDPTVYFLDHLPFTVRAGDLAAIVVSSALISLLATIYPALRAARLDPVEAIRDE